MTRLALIGYGNTLRGDDAIGRLAAEELSRRVDDPRVTVMTLHQLNPELAETIASFDAVLFIDAATDGEPGEIRVRAVEPRLDDSGLTHSASPEALLVLARELYGRAPGGTLFTLSGESFELEERLSSSVAAALPRLVALVASSVETALAPPAARLA